MTSLVVAALLGAAGLSWALCGLVRRIASTRGVVVPPRSDRWHSTPTPTMGGTGFGAATLLAASGVWLWMGTPLTPQQVAVPAAAAAMLCIGLFADGQQLSPLAKLVSSLIIGALVVFVIGAGPTGSLPWPATILAVVWFGGVVHALNLLDNMDGLAAGIALCGAALLAYLFAPVLGDAVVVFLAALAGAAAGFLYWNRHPARLFMGDSGSLFLGAALAAASLMPLVAARANFWHTASVVGFVLAVPLFDTGFVLVLRRLAGRKATRGGTDHLSHRLVSLGFSERSAVRILYLFGLTAGLVAFLVQNEGLQPMLPLAALFLIAAVLVGIYLARVPAYEAEDFRVLQKSTFSPFLRDLAFRWHAGQVLLDVVLIAVCYYAAYRIRFEGEMLENFFPYFTASLPFVIGCKLGALYVSGLYWRSWESFTLLDLFVVVRGVVIGSVLSVMTAAYIYRLEGFSRAVFLIDGVLLLLAVAGTRASFRAMGDLAHQRRKTVKRAVVYGAGAFGQLLVREMRANPDWSMRTVAFIDDDTSLTGRYVLGVRVAGGFDALEQILASTPADDVILSSPAIDGAREAAVREICARRGVGVRRLHMSVQ